MWFPAIAVVRMMCRIFDRFTGRVMRVSLRLRVMPVAGSYAGSG